MFGKEDEESAIDATPLSKIQSTAVSAHREQSTLLPQKRGAPVIQKSPPSSQTRSGKRLRPSQGGEPVGQSQKMSKFQLMIEDQIPDDAIKEWDKLKLVEVAREKSLASAKSFYLDLKFGDQIVETAQGDRKLREEVKQLKGAIRTNDAEVKSLKDQIDKLRLSHVSLSKDKGHLYRAINKLISEKESLSKEIAGLKIQADKLKQPAIATKATRDEKRVAFDVGMVVGVNSCIKSTAEMFPNLDLSRLGEDAATIAAEVRVKMEISVKQPIMASAPADEQISNVEPSKMDSPPAAKAEAEAETSPLDPEAKNAINPSSTPDVIPSNKSQ